MYTAQDIFKAHFSIAAEIAIEKSKRSGGLSVCAYSNKNMVFLTKRCLGRWKKLDAGQRLFEGFEDGMRWAVCLLPEPH